MKLQLSEKSILYFQKIILYLAKMSLFSCDLAEQPSVLLAGAVIFIGLKTL
jgi:hypothetical protein